jgi:hypothetical protein
MLSGLNTTGHEIGGSLGVAVLATIALAATGGAPEPGAGVELATGIGNAFVAAAGLAIAASLVALIVLPSARLFLPRLRLAPSSMPIH